MFLSVSLQSVSLIHSLALSHFFSLSPPSLSFPSSLFNLLFSLFILLSLYPLSLSLLSLSLLSLSLLSLFSLSPFSLSLLSLYPLSLSLLSLLSLSLMPLPTARSEPTVPSRFVFCFVVDFVD